MHGPVTARQTWVSTSGCHRATGRVVVQRHQLPLGSPSHLHAAMSPTSEFGACRTGNGSSFSYKFLQDGGTVFLHRVGKSLGFGSGNEPTFALETSAPDPYELAKQ